MASLRGPTWFNFVCVQQTPISPTFTTRITNLGMHGSCSQAASQLSCRQVLRRRENRREAFLQWQQSVFTIWFWMVLMLRGSILRQQMEQMDTNGRSWTCSGYSGPGEGRDDVQPLAHHKTRQLESSNAIALSLSSSTGRSKDNPICSCVFLAGRKRTWHFAACFETIYSI